jgi:hypothetical protein
MPAEDGTAHKKDSVALSTRASLRQVRFVSLQNEKPAPFGTLGGIMDSLGSCRRIGESTSKAGRKGTAPRYSRRGTWASRKSCAARPSARASGVAACAGGEPTRTAPPAASRSAQRTRDSSTESIARALRARLKSNPSSARAPVPSKSCESHAARRRRKRSRPSHDNGTRAIDRSIRPNASERPTLSRT